jgi:hypothetical protein
MVFDNTNFRRRVNMNVTASRPASRPAPASASAPRLTRSIDAAPVSTSRRNINPAFHLSRFISNAANTGPCRACGH